MDMSHLMPVGNRYQIISVIEKAAPFGGDLWQSQLNLVDRYVSQLVQVQNDFSSDCVIFKTPSSIQINPKLPIFVRLSYRNLIFRVMPGDFKIEGATVSCRYPTEARALDERNGNRYVLPFSADFSLSIKRLERAIRETTYEMELRMVDVSEKGFGVIISAGNSDYFKKHDHFWLKAVEHEPLRTPILGCVCYVEQKGSLLKRGDVRVGLSLSVPIERSILENLKKQSFVILSA